MESGYVLDVCWSCELDDRIKSLKGKDSKFLPGIFNSIETESDLRNGIENGSLYGFIFCNLSSTEETIKKWEKFPPILKRMTVTYEHLSQSMKDQLKLEKPEETKFERETLVQGFFAVDQVILTTLARFYLRQGIKIENITGFVQYVPSRCLDPFASHDMELNGFIFLFHFFICYTFHSINSNKYAYRGF